MTLWSGTPQNLQSDFTIRHAGAENLKGFFEAGQNHENLAAEFLLRQENENLFAKAQIAHFERLFAKFTVRHSSSNTLFAKFIVRQEATKNLYAKFEAQDSEALKGIVTVRHSASETLKGICIVRHDASPLSLISEFRVTIEGWEMQGLDAGTYRDLGVIS